MIPVVSNSSAVDSSSLSLCDHDLPADSLDFFLKDERKISVGDCALFKPPKDSPPFIGIIRGLKTEGEGILSIRVNWLYRKSDLKLGKSVLLDAVPNEIFYSFHEDIIPSVSLLHPCKVAFLHKGVDLPSELLSFVCRRVYDTENKCLWWLTDKNYVNERQEEVDKLLKKTSLEMHGAVQSGGRSPKPLTAATSTSQVKGSSETGPTKSKKRERSDQASDSSKRECLQKVDRGDCGQAKPDQMLKSEIAKITDRGGLVDLVGVEKLVQLMQPEDSDKRIDVAGRIMLAEVISVTDRFDCLSWFVQLKGLSVLDGWLQEVHRRKNYDGENAKENEKNDVEFLMALLRALGKLPVNLNALQNCNVGKSVNNLRNHKNGEVAKKAKSLVETWKKRVGAEMNMNDMKSGQSRAVACPSKPASSEGSLVENKKHVPTVLQSSVGKISQAKGADGFGKLPVSSSSAKSVVSSSICTSSNLNQKESPLTPIKEERSSSSSQSLNNSQSCSGDQGKTAGSSYKEDARSSTTGSASKSCSCASRHQKSSNGVHTPVVSGVIKDIASGKTIPSNKNSSSEKSSPTGLSQERLTEVPVDFASNQRVIVKLPSGGRSPSCDEDPSLVNVKPSEKKVKVKSEFQPQVEVPVSKVPENCQSKDGITGTEPNALAVCVEQQRGNDDVKSIDVLKTSTPRSGKQYDSFLSSMNALVESCVKISEAGASISPEDDGGMNLLASVAAGEMVKSENASSSSSPQRHVTLQEATSSENKIAAGCEEAVPSSKPEDVTCNSSVLTSPVKSSGDLEGGENSSASGLADRCSPSSKGRVRSSLPKDVVKSDDFCEKPSEIVAALASDPLSCSDKDLVLSEMNVLEQYSSENGSGVPSKMEEQPTRVSSFLQSEIKMDSEEREVHPTIDEVNVGLSGLDHINTCMEKKPGRDEPDEQASASASGSGSNIKLDFDLNEGFPCDDSTPAEPTRLASFGSSSLHVPCPLPAPVLPISGNFPNSITVAAAAKGSFVPPEIPLREKGELGWKGSAATSAFRPVEISIGSGEVSGSDTNKPGRRFLDIDLNVADDKLVEESPSHDRVSSGLDLDLNRAQENPEAVSFSSHPSSRLEFPPVFGRSNGSRDFDLNNGPGLDESMSDISVSRSQTMKNPFPSSGSSSIRIHGGEFGNFSWFPPTNSYSPLSVPSIIPSRNDHSFIPTASQKILPPPNPTSSFGLEMYRGPVLPSSPAVPFPSITPFPYSGFPFDTSFAPSTSSFSATSSIYGDSTPGSSLCFPSMPSQLVVPSGVLSSPYFRPFIMNLPDVPGSVASDIRKFGPIDLNSGPAANDSDRRDDRFPSRQHISSASQNLSDRLSAGTVLKRKEPDGGWDSSDRFTYKQASWQ